MASINPLTSGAPTGNILVDSLVWGGSWASWLGTPASLDWAIVHSAEYDGGTLTSSKVWSAAATSGLRLALSLWSEVAGLSFTEAAPDTAGTDLSFLLLGPVAMQRVTGQGGSLGESEVPDGADPGPLTTLYNAGGQGWTDAGLARGGYGFVTLVHEIGHLLGLAHPHDGGGDGQVFPGVTAASDLGAFGMNQGIWTVMSYNDGWVSEFPDHAALGYGWQAGPMALDIAAIQAVYGANRTTRTGDDLYALPPADGAGTYWSCIWDAGGIDTISAGGVATAAVIDLRAAPLTGANAGGFVSSVAGVIGGFTIANRVVIENALGGTGNDRVTGNAAANLLMGEGGADRIFGGPGADTIIGGAGKDVLTGGPGADHFVFDQMPSGKGTADRINDFTPDADVIVLDHRAFAGIGPLGALDAAAFVLGSRAADAASRVIYDAETGLLRFDADGRGGAASLVFAEIGANLALDASSFWVM